MVSTNTTSTSTSTYTNTNTNNDTTGFVPTPHINEKKKIRCTREYHGDDSSLIYKSGIPTLRASAHRVKVNKKGRKLDPKPIDRDGNETNTTWLPIPLQDEDVFPYDINLYDLKGAIINLLVNCDPDIIGSFDTTTNHTDLSSEEQQRPSSSSSFRLEDFRVPVSTTWRSVNGGNCEDAQRYLSDQVASNEYFLEVFDKFVKEVALPYLKCRLVACGALESDYSTCAFYYQRPPTIRLQPGPGWAKVKPHNDAEYGHQNGEINMWMPLTDRTLTGVDLLTESSLGAADYHPIKAKVGEAITWHGSSRKHYVNANASSNTRVSLDFRIGVEGYFDPFYQMQGTTDDHTRKKVVL